jgi:stage V sporulation protein SpoVS
MQVAVISAEAQEPSFMGTLVAALRERGTPPPYEAVVVTAPAVAPSLELSRMMRELLREDGVALVAYEAHCAPKPIDGGLLYAGSFGVGAGDVYCVMSRVVGVWADKKLCRRSSTRSERDVQLRTCARAFIAAPSIERAVETLVLGM